MATVKLEEIKRESITDIIITKLHHNPDTSTMLPLEQSTLAPEPPHSQDLLGGAHHTNIRSFGLINTNFSVCLRRMFT